MRSTPTWPTILAWLENCLSDEEAQVLNTHVADCYECRERLALMNVVLVSARTAGVCVE